MVFITIRSLFPSNVSEIRRQFGTEDYFLTTTLKGLEPYQLLVLHLWTTNDTNCHIFSLFLLKISTLNLMRFIPTSFFIYTRSYNFLLFDSLRSPHGGFYFKFVFPFLVILSAQFTTAVSLPGWCSQDGVATTVLLLRR